MSYSTVITFPIENINASDTYQLILTFDHSIEGTNRNWDAETKKLLISNHGKIKWEYKLEDTFLVPGVVDLEIIDKNGVLDDLFFGNNYIALNTDKQAKVEIKINGSTEFIGHILEDSIISTGIGAFSYMINFTATPKMDKIKAEMIYDEDDNPLNPFGYTWGEKYTIQTILSDIFKLVNENVSVEIIHDWIFKGKRSDPFDKYEKDDITFEQLLLTPDVMYNIPATGLRNCRDILQNFANSWAAFTGMIHEEKAFFKKLFNYNPNNLQELGQVNEFKKQYKYMLVQYVKIRVEVLNSEAKAGVYTEMNGRYFVKEDIFYGVSAAGNNVWAEISEGGSEDGTYYLTHVKDTNISPSWMWNGELLKDFWYNNRSNIQKNRADYFDVSGVGYNYLKDFNYNGYKYQIISLEKDFERDKSIIEALFLGAL